MTLQMTIKKMITTAFPYLLFTGLGLFSYLLLVNAVNIPEGMSESIYTIWALIFFVITFNIVGHVTIKISSWLNNQYVLNGRHRWRIALIYAGVMVAFLLLNYGLLVCAKLLIGAKSPFVFPNGGVRILITVWLVELVVLGLLLANKSMQKSLKLQQQAAILQHQNNLAKYTALQNQLNPHFLFNSLNTLIAEIEFDPKNAIGFTKNLSNVYRYVLQCQDRRLVTLGEEVEFAQAYLFLHEVRLGKCITISLDIPIDYLESSLPPLTLQLLVENIIKHNTITANRPIEIKIYVENQWLVVENSINPKKSIESSGVGLKNLSSRCLLTLGSSLEIVADENRFTVKVPLQYE